MEVEVAACPECQVHYLVHCRALAAVEEEEEAVHCLAFVGGAVAAVEVEVEVVEGPWSPLRLEVVEVAEEVVR